MPPPGAFSLTVALGVLFVWRVTHLLHAEDGPWRVVARLRQAAGGVLGEALDCFYCLTLWIAAPVAAVIGPTWRYDLLLWPALSGAACLLQRATDRQPFSGLVYEAPSEETDHVLRPIDQADPSHPQLP
jgi:hypothetical protein